MCSLWIVYYKHTFIIAINFFLSPTAMHIYIHNKIYRQQINVCENIRNWQSRETWNIAKTYKTNTQHRTNKNIWPTRNARAVPISCKTPTVMILVKAGRKIKRKTLCQTCWLHFSNVNFQFTSSNIPASSAYRVYILRV
jgi:hypothetical protein